MWWSPYSVPSRKHPQLGVQAGVSQVFDLKHSECPCGPQASHVIPPKNLLIRAEVVVDIAKV